MCFYCEFFPVGFDGNGRTHKGDPNRWVDVVMAYNFVMYLDSR